jgi:hypothetical protein
VKVLGEYIDHHVKEEQDELFPKLTRKDGHEGRRRAVAGAQGRTHGRGALTRTPGRDSREPGQAKSSPWTSVSSSAFLRAHESAHYALCRIPALLVILGSREL